MRKLLYSLCIIVLAAGIVFAGDVSFKSVFVNMPGWRQKVTQKSDMFKSSGMSIAQGYYVKDIKKVIVSIAVGKEIQKTPGNPVGYSFGYAGIIMKVIRKFGFATMITFNNKKRPVQLSLIFPRLKGRNITECCPLLLAI